VTLSIPDEPLDLTEVKRTALFRAAQEAVVNVRKHAEATQIDISLEIRGRRLIIRVEDDGVGRVDRYGLGLTTNAERLDALGGGLEVSATPRSGSRVRAWMPTDAASV
jgi:signal transduction histidine kinase